MCSGVQPWNGGESKKEVIGNGVRVMEISLEEETISELAVGGRTLGEWQR